MIDEQTETEQPYLEMMSLALSILGGDDNVYDDRDAHNETIKAYFISQNDMYVAGKVVDYALDYMGGYLDDVTPQEQTDIIRSTKQDMMPYVAEFREQMATQ